MSNYRTFKESFARGLSNTQIEVFRGLSSVGKLSVIASDYIFGISEMKNRIEELEEKVEKLSSAKKTRRTRKNQEQNENV